MDPEPVWHGLDVSRPPMRQRLSRGWHAASHQCSIHGSSWQTALRQQHVGITGAATLFRDLLLTVKWFRAPATCPRSPKDSVPWQPKPLSTGKSCSSPAGSQFRAAAVRQNVTSGPRFRAGSRFRAVAVRQDAHRMCMLQRQTFSTHRKTVAGIRTSEVHAHSASRGKYMALNGHRSVSLYR